MRILLTNLTTLIIAATIGYYVAECKRDKYIMGKTLADIHTYRLLQTDVASARNNLSLIIQQDLADYKDLQSSPIRRLVFNGSAVKHSFFVRRLNEFDSELIKQGAPLHNEGNP